MPDTEITAVPVNGLTREPVDESTFHRMRALITLTIFANDPAMAQVRCMEEALASASAIQQKMRIIQSTYLISRNEMVKAAFGRDLADLEHARGLAAKQSYLETIQKLSATYSLDLQNIAGQGSGQIATLAVCLDESPLNDTDRYNLFKIGDDIFEKVVALAIAALANHHRKQTLRFEPGNTPAP